MPPLPIILILGPTAGGKTRLSLDLAKSLPGGGECISADSMQVYRGMDIGTAKPTPAEQAEAPHHLLDLLDPSEDGFSVDTWLGLAERAIEYIRGRGKWPIVVGGTNLYIQALLHGMFDGPEPDAQLRSRLNAADQDELRRRLEEIDPAAAQRIHRNDRKRTIRAIEVFEQTGKRLSDLQTQWEASRPREDVIIIGLDYSAEAINPRINARVKQMIEEGLVEEVRTLHESNRLGRQAREALGYKQIIDHLDGRCSLEDAIEQIKIKTRQYAKQQRTWLKRFRRHPNATWIDAAGVSSEDIADQATQHILAVIGATAES